MSELQWPADRCDLDLAEVDRLASVSRHAFRAVCRDLRIDADLDRYLPALYVPLADWLRRRRGDRREPLVVGVCGGQGSGKSTACALLAAVASQGFGLRSAVLSIDDVYETREARAALARDAHPLFATRGVPGTHDVALGIATVEGLRRLGPGETLALPRFDKARDTRAPRSDWPTVTGPVDLVLFEGWCVGAAPQPESALVRPVNALEAEEDADGRWRSRVNRALAGEYRTLFGLLDVLVLLAVPGMEQVYAWRRLQERKLAAAACGRGDGDLRVMTGSEVDRFVMHYERITRHVLEEMPGRADLVIHLDRDHRPARLRFNDPAG